MEALFRGFHANPNGNETITINGKEIKGEWVEGYYVKSIRKSGFENNPTIKEIHQIWYDKKYENGFVVEQVYNEVIPETVSQFTGLTDKNGKKIFKGDRVIHLGEKRTAIVEFINGEFSCEKYGFNIKASKCFKVIGNIFSNPELLEVKE